MRDEMVSLTGAKTPRGMAQKGQSKSSSSTLHAWWVMAGVLLVVAWVRRGWMALPDCSNATRTTVKLFAANLSGDCSFAGVQQDASVLFSRDHFSNQ